MRIGFIGVGSMGRYMAANLVTAGHEVTAVDPRPEAREDPVLAGASWADRPAAAADAADVVITSLPGPDQVREVLLGADGVLASMGPGSVSIDMSTSTPELAREVDAAAAGRGVLSIDAPVSGGPRGARHGTLTILVGGEAAAYQASLPILQCMGERIFHLGAPGAGHVAKLVNNMMGLTNGVAAMEAMVVGTRAGLDPRTLYEAVKASAGDSFVLNMLPHVIFKGAFEPAKFALSLAAKDLRLAVGFADEMGVPIRVVRDASLALADAEQQGLGGSDWGSYITLLEAAAGVVVRDS